MRPSGRKFDELRQISLETGYAKHAEGSCMVKMGDTMYRKCYNQTSYMVKESR